MKLKHLLKPQLELMPSFPFEITNGLVHEVIYVQLLNDPTLEFLSLFYRGKTGLLQQEIAIEDGELLTAKKSHRSRIRSARDLRRV